MLLREELLAYQSTGTLRKKKKRYLFLLRDTLLITKPSGSKKGKYYLKFLIAFGPRTSVGHSLHTENEFSIVSPQRVTIIILLFYFYP